MKKLIISIGYSLFVVFIPISAIADSITIQKEYSYLACEADTEESSRTLALEHVKKLLLDDIGTHLYTEAEIKNSDLTKDQITALITWIVRMDILDEKWDGKEYYIEAKITADFKEIITNVDKLRQEPQDMKRLVAIRKKTDELIQKVERLKRELEFAKLEVKEQKQKDYNETIKELSAVDWHEKGYSIKFSGKKREAIYAISKAVELNPKDPELYYTRGGFHVDMGDYREAINDFDRVTELNPKYSIAYIARGYTYFELGQFREAIKNFDKGIPLLHDIECVECVACFHVFRGVAHLKLESYQEAIKDFDKIIESYPNFTEIIEIYHFRAAAHLKLDNYQQAIKDLDMVIKMNPKSAKAYFHRGLSHAAIMKYDQAINDYDKAIELDPQNAEVYFKRGIAYNELDNYGHTVKNMALAARMGHPKAQDFLRAREIIW